MQLDELIALNDEIAALARSGVPLGRGLLDTSRDVPGRLSQITSRLGSAMEQGHSLETAVRQCEEIPPLYAAIVAAGEQSGKLAATVQQTATSLRRLAELRQSIISATLYPLIVVILAASLFTFFVSDAYGPLMELVFSRELTVEGGWLESWLTIVTRMGAWLFIIPPIVLGLAMIWAARTRSAGIASVGRHHLAFALVPGAYWLSRWSQLATLTEVLSLLVESGTPIPRALRLAADAADGWQLKQDAERLATAVEQAQTQPWQSPSHAGMPNLVAWLVQGGLRGASSFTPPDPSTRAHGQAHRHNELAENLHRLSVGYLAKARVRCDALQHFWPAMAVLLIAGSATFAYAAAFVIPWFATLWRIALNTV